MVAFGTYLTSFRNPAWADKYVDYELLKSNIYAIEAALNSLPEGERTAATASKFVQVKAFDEELASDLEKISAFYAAKLAESTAEFGRLQTKVERTDMKKMPESDREQVKHDLQSLYIELSMLRDYSSLNYTGFSKILKKHDKTLPVLKMKRDYFKANIDKRSVFGTQDELHRLQVRTQQIYAEYFCGFNRLDAEISFGEALAKATAETQRASSKMDKQKNTSAELSKPMTIDTAGDQFLLAEHVQGYSRRKAEETNVISSALWQRARVTMMAVNSFRREPVIFPIITSLLYMFVGGLGQAFCLEYMVKIDPGCGSTITFFQFVFVALEGIQNYITWDSSATGFLGKARTLWMKPLKIPIKYHAGCVLMSWFAAVLSSWAYMYKVSVPFHMVFKSSILLVNMMIGAIVLRKRYSFGQIGSVVMVSIGVMISTFAALPAKPADDNVEGQIDFWQWILGVAILALSLVFTGFLGILQDMAYRNYGNHWQEALFYAHFLGLPLFLSLAPEMVTHMIDWTFNNPTMWLILLLNTIASFLGVRGMYNLTSLTSSLTGNLMITVRKFLSLILSIVFFKNVFGLSHWSGASLVLLGTVLYTNASQRAAKSAAAKKDS